jgi:hypothetical protein
MQAEILPNPSLGKLFICGMQEGTRLTVYNESGEKILPPQLLDNQSVIDLSEQPEGEYFIELYANRKVDLRKITLKKY